MTLASPLMLLLLVPIGALAALFARGGVVAGGGLPGAWSRIVAAPLRRFLAAGTATRRGRQVWLCIGIAAAIAVALSKPTLDNADRQGFGNLAGRVIVVDLHPNAELSRQRLAVERLINAAPEIPTALLAVGGDAYPIVPLTTDRRQIMRYLNVLQPDAMPVAGRALHRGIAAAEAMLRGAGSAVRQIIVISDGAPPDRAVQIAASSSLRTIVPVDGDTAAWQGFAKTYGANLASADAPGQTVGPLRAKIDHTLRSRAPTAVLDLTPFVIAFVLLLWLWLFRRRASA